MIMEVMGVPDAPTCSAHLPKNNAMQNVWHLLHQHSQQTLMASSRKAVEASSSFALGAISGLLTLQNSSKGHLSQYFLMVERLCESYYDTPTNCTSQHIDFNLNASIEQAFFQPRSLIPRTAINWESRFPVSAKNLPRQWCRALGFYTDWASHIPELQQLDMEDKLRMLTGRMKPCWWLLVASRSIILAGGKVAFFCDGGYFPLDPGEQSHVDADVAFFRPLCNLINCELIRPALDIRVRAEELALLKVLCFCVPVAHLEPVSTQIIQSAQAKYQAALVEEVMKNKDGVMDRECAMTGLLDRLAKMMSWLSAVERVAEENNRHLSLMTLFNIAEMKGSLPYELHVRAG